MMVGLKLLVFIGGGAILVGAGAWLFRRIFGVPTPDPTIKQDPFGGLPEGSGSGHSSDGAH